MKEENIYDLIVIGGGPAGYSGAIRAGQLNKKVLCVEMDKAGGTCLNWGCIPSKTLLKSAELYQIMKHSETYGFSCENIKVNFSKVMARSRKVAEGMKKGIEFLFKKNRVQYISGKAKILNTDLVEIINKKGEKEYFYTKNILISTGCKAKKLKNIIIDKEKIMTSREALLMQVMPESITIIGGGAIGIEFAYFLNAFGCKVTLVERLKEIIPTEDEEISKTLRRSLMKQGINFYLDTEIKDINIINDCINIKCIKNNEIIDIKSEKVLLAIGVDANIEDLCESNINIEQKNNFIKVNNNYETNIKGIYAAGDIVGPPWLAHIATFEAIQAVDGMFKIDKPKLLSSFPTCIYSQPQVASIGMTENELKLKNIPYKIGKFPFLASGKAVAINKPEGFVKVIIDTQYGEILGAHIIGGDATELIAEYALAMKLEARIDDVYSTIHAHPTLSEALAEAAAETRGKSIHI